MNQSNREPTGAPERFDHFMDRVLYGADGFYTNRGTAGRSRGDFITSPEVGPLFGAVLAEAIDHWWSQAGSPDRFPVYDVGCGPGSLLRAIRIARPDRPWDLTGVDRSNTAAEETELPDDLSGAVVLANELLDNLPFRIVEHRSDGYYEIYVSDGREVLLPTELKAAIPVGTRAPVHHQAGEWIASILDREPAVLCLFDYGARTTAELAERGGWLRTYRQHQRGSDALEHPGQQDITTDVAWDQLPVPNGLVRQAEFLRLWSIDRLVDEGRAHWAEHAHAPRSAGDAYAFPSF